MNSFSQSDPIYCQTLMVQIDEAKRTMNPAECLEHVIKLYGSELEKCNELIANLRAEPAALVELIRLYVRLRDCLKRWAARYADSAHAQRHVKETRLLMQELDAWYEKLPHHVKD